MCEFAATIKRRLLHSFGAEAHVRRRRGDGGRVSTAEGDEQRSESAPLIIAQVDDLGGAGGAGDETDEGAGGGGRGAADARLQPGFI